jgi:autotransporter-associated beta strand protein
VANGITATIAATLNGNEGLLKDGAGTLVLSGNNTYSGGTTVSIGTLKLELGPRSGNPPFGSFSVDSGATLNLDNTNTVVGSYYPQSFVLSGEGTLTKTNTGSIDLWTGSNLTGFTGTVNVQQGSLRVNNIGTAANMAQATLEIAAGATFDVRYNARLSVDKLTGSGILDQSSNFGGRLGAVTIGANHGSSTFNGSIRNTSGVALPVTKSGTGTFTLAGINTYTGNTTINDGTLILADDARLTFVVTHSSQNTIGGSGTATLKGDFLINTTAVTGATAGTWLLVDIASLAPASSFDDATFTVIDFVDPENDGIWTMTDAKGNWAFSEATGTLSLAVGSDYDDWGATYGLTTGSEGGDLDTDGLSNFEEYAFGLLPNSGSSVNPIISQFNKTTGQFTYQRRLQSNTDINYSVRSSTTLATNEWNNLVKDTDYTESLSAAGDIETVTITLTPVPTSSKLFIQIKAEAP